MLKSGFGVRGSEEGCAKRGDKVDPAQFDGANKKLLSKTLALILILDPGTTIEGSIDYERVRR